jgi:hypothetical protein
MNISASEVRKLFFIFRDGMYEMRDEHFNLPENLAELNCQKDVECTFGILKNVARIE